MKDLGVVGERQVVGEPRGAAQARVAQVELGRLGQLALALNPAARDGRVERRLELGVELGHLVVGLVQPVGQRDALFHFGPRLVHLYPSNPQSTPTRAPHTRVYATSHP